MADVSPRKKIEQALDWDVHRIPLQLEDGTPLESHVANVRMLEGQPHVLGVVGKGYEIIQNEDLLSMAEAVQRKHKLSVTFAGVIGQGERVFLQCAGEAFSVGGSDEVRPYMLFANGHDGGLSCRMTPMTERLACTNQLRNIAKENETWLSIRHYGDVKTKMEEAGRLARHFLTVSAANRSLMVRLRDRGVTHKRLAKFFEQMYSLHYGPVVGNPQSKSESQAKGRAETSFDKFVQRFEADVPVAGATAWNMANAYTGWLQHDHRVGRDPAQSSYRRYVSSLFGVLADRSVEAFQSAMTA